VVALTQDASASPRISGLPVWKQAYPVPGILVGATSVPTPIERIRVFLSYRRTDDRHLAGRLRDVLAIEFGDENVFFDVDTIGAGQDFRVVIREYIDDTDVILALIGPRWEPSRLTAPNDFVRAELAEALRQARPVIPVLIDDTAMPSPDQLPEELERLAFLHALVVRPDPDFRTDAARVTRAVQVVHQRAAPVREGTRAREQEMKAEVELARAEAATTEAAAAAAEAELERTQAENAETEQVRLAAEAETAKLRAESERERARADALAAELSTLAAQLEAERLRAERTEAEQVRRLLDAQAEQEAARAKVQAIRERREAAELRNSPPDGTEEKSAPGRHRDENAAQKVVTDADAEQASAQSSTARPRLLPPRLSRQEIPLGQRLLPRTPFARTLLVGAALMLAVVGWLLITDRDGGGSQDSGETTLPGTASST
jgi:hypothetical protein